MCVAMGSPASTGSSAILLELEKKMSEEFRNYYVGKEAEVLMEEEMEYQGETYFTGYTKEYVKVAVKGDKNLSNTFVSGTITGHLTEEIYLLQM